MKYNILFFLSLSMLISLVSCSEDEVNFPDYEKDWFVMEDNAGDSVAHAGYQFYQKYKIPVFINDTIGTQQRVDLWGNTYTYYKTLSLNFAMGGSASAYSDPYLNTMTFCDKSVVPSALRYLDSHIMPSVPKSIHIHSILLVENLQSRATGTEVFNSINTLIIGNASQLASYTAEQTQSLKSTLLSLLVGKALTSNADYSEDLDLFYQVSRSLYSVSDIYNTSTWYFNKDRMPGCPFDPYDYSVTGKDKMLWAGFLDVDPANPYYSPSSPLTDVQMYIKEYLKLGDAQFRSLYANYPNVIKKYEIVKPLIDSAIQ